MRLGFTLATAAPIAAATGPAAPFVIGAMALASVIPFIEFGKSEEQKGYDAARQQYWDAYIQLSNQVNPIIETMSRDQLGQAINVLDKLANDFSHMTDEAVKVEDRAWVLPRFRDYYDPMLDTLDDWYTAYFAKPVPTTAQGLFNQAEDLLTVGGVNWLGPLAALGLYLALRK
jgi:hypothetical protein